MTSDIANETPPNVDDATADFDGEPGTTPGGRGHPFGRTRSESPGSEVPPRLAPPRGYPDAVWHDDGVFAVDVELRPFYVAVADAGTGSVAEWRDVPKDATARIPMPDGSFEIRPLDFDTFSHVRRRNAARNRKAHEERETAEAIRTTVECVVCGLREHFARMKTVRVGDVSAIACPDDAALLEAELRSREPIAENRTRSDAVHAAADRLMPNGTLPPLELRSGS